MDHSTSSFTQLKKNIGGFVSKHYLSLSIRGLIYLAALVLVLFICFSLTAYFTWPGTITRAIIFYLTIIILGSFSVQFVLLPLLAWLKVSRGMDEKKASHIIGNYFPEVKDKLLNTLQLDNLQHGAGVSADSSLLLSAGIGQKATALNEFKFSRAVDLGKNFRYLRFVFLPLTLLLLLLLFLPGALTEGASRIIHYSTPYTRPAPFTFNLLSGSEVEVNKPYKIVLKLKCKGNLRPSEVLILDQSSAFLMKAEGNDVYSYIMPGTATDQTIQFNAASFNSDSYHLFARQPAKISRLTLTLLYPQSTHLKTDVVYSSGEFNVPERTAAIWKFEGDHFNAIKEVGSDQKQVLLTRARPPITLARQILNSASFAFLPINDTGLSGDTLKFHFNVLKDNPPTIDVIPDSSFLSKSMNLSQKKRFTVTVTDDYGISGVHALVQVTNSQGVKAKPAVFDLRPNGLRSQVLSYSITPGQVINAPGSTLSLWFEAKDNNASKVSIAKSRDFVFSVPSLNDQRNMLSKDASQTKTHLADAQRLASQISQQARDLSEKLANSSSISFEEKSQSESLLRQVESLQKDLERLPKENKEASSPRHSADDPEKNPKQELDKRMQELLDPATRSLLDKLRRILAENNKSSLRDGLQKLDNTNHDRAQELTRLNELYKKEIRSRQRELIKEQLETLSKEQADLAKQPSSESPISQQEKLNEQFEKTIKDSRELSPSTKTDPADAQKESMIAQTKEKMELAVKDLKRKNNLKAKDDQTKAAKDLQEIAKSMEEKEESEDSEELKQNLSSLRPILENLLRVSFSQEDIMTQLSRLRPSDPSYRNLVRRESDLKDDLGFIQDSVVALSKKIPQIQGFVNKEFNMANQNMRSVVQLLSDHRQYEAAGKQQFVMTAINNLAVLLSNTENQLQKASQNSGKKGKGKSHQPGIARLTELQRKLTGDMSRSNLGKSPGENGNEGYAKLAARQEAIRRELQKIMARESSGVKRPGNEASKEMEQIERGLLNKADINRLIPRQREILTRMLEAEDARQKQEQDQRRAATTGVDTFRVLNIIKPGLNSLSGINPAITSESVVFPGINSFYKPKINSYFDQIKAGR